MQHYFTTVSWCCSEKCVHLTLLLQTAGTTLATTQLNSGAHQTLKPLLVCKIV
jgi:hypothetical protein